MARRTDTWSILLSEGGGEYANVDLFCEKSGIVRQRAEADNPASNGKAERMHQTVLNMARCMIFNCRLPMYYWGDVVKYVGRYRQVRGICFESKPL